MRLLTALCASGALIFLHGCATTSPAPVPAGTNVTALNDWQAHGRLGVSGPAGGGSGSFDWQQHAAQSTLSIRGPAGIGSMRMLLDTSTAQPQISLEASGRKLEADQALAELETRLGASIPAVQLRYWLLGVAAPGEHRWYTDDPENTRLEQDGWSIDYSKFSTTTGPRLPGSIKATNGATRVKVVVDRWQLTP